MMISQKSLNFGMKSNCPIQDNTVGNGLGNRSSTEKAPNRNFEVSRQRRTKDAFLAPAVITKRRALGTSLEPFAD
jgi:hypothetical protein